jgi:hypothetical protein
LNKNVAYQVGIGHWLGWFLRADPPDQHTKTSWCFIGPALRLRRLAKTSQPPNVVLNAITHLNNII